MFYDSFISYFLIARKKLNLWVYFKCREVVVEGTFRHPFLFWNTSFLFLLKQEDAISFHLVINVSD